MSQVIRHISWPEVGGMFARLARRCPPDVDLVVGIARGGLPAAVFVDYELGASSFGVVSLRKFRSEQPFDRREHGDVEELAAALPDCEPRRVLVVDDVICHGDVLARAAEVVRRRYGDAVTLSFAVLLLDVGRVGRGPHASMVGDIAYVEDLDSSKVWVQFPWLQGETPVPVEEQTR